ncbi:DUF6531 domain-containing protein [Amycolatopsis sp. NBC_01307]|uniref:DUF6531 domain-containing protein n=1 Tax=Amycolatopsis sp. NBC_01307 TaxID=2903561 RepID=UPI003FA38CE1
MSTRRTSCRRPALVVATTLVLLSGGLLAVTPAEAGPAAVLTPTLTGARPSATRIPFPISDKVSASVDVGTGNLLVTTSELALPGIQADLQLGLTFNSLRLGSGAALPSGSAGAGWAMRVGQDTKVILNSDNSVLYLAPEGREGLFQPAGGTAYTAPAGFKVVMVKTASGWTITDHDTNAVSTFDSTGQLVSIKDRNAQTSAFTYASGKLFQVTSTRGGAGARTANLTWSGTVATIGQTGDDGTARSATYTYTAGKLTKITDPTSKDTQFGYDPTTGDLTTITNEAGKQTAIQYDASHRVKKVTQENPAGGAATRFTYYSAGETLVASPNNTEAIPANGPQTDYFLNAQELVTSVADPLGRGRAKTYTPFTDVATSTSGTGGVTTFGHDPAVNAGESLTGVTARPGRRRPRPTPTPARPSTCPPVAPTGRATPSCSPTTAPATPSARPTRPRPRRRRSTTTPTAPSTPPPTRAATSPTTPRTPITRSPTSPRRPARAWRRSPSPTTGSGGCTPSATAAGCAPSTPTTAPTASRPSSTPTAPPTWRSPTTAPATSSPAPTPRARRPSPTTRRTGSPRAPRTPAAAPCPTDTTRPGT